MKLPKVQFIIIVAFLLIGAATYIFIKKNLLDRVKTTLTDQTDSLLHSFDTFSRDQVNFSKLLAADKELQNLAIQLNNEYLKGVKVKASPLQEILRDHLRDILNFSGNLGFFIVNQDLISISSMRDNNTGTVNLLHKHPSFFKKIWDGQSVMSVPVFSDVTLTSNPILRDRTFFVGTPLVINKNHKIALLIRVDINKLYKVISSFTSLKTGEAYLVSSKGLLLSPSRYNNFTPLEDYVRIPKTDQLTYSVLEVINKRSGMTTNLYTNYSGEEVIGSWNWLENYNVGIIKEISIDDALAPLVSLKYIIFITVFVLLTISIISITIILEKNKKLQSSNQALDLLINDKNLLLKELSHRVKNNFQLISSLLSLHKRKIEDEETKTLLSNISNRIFAISLIHDEIFQQKNNSSILLSDYITNLTNHIKTSYGEYSNEKIQINLNFNLDLEVSQDNALSLGIVVNELVTNSIKNYFSKKELFELIIYIALKKEEDTSEYKLFYTDNGDYYSKEMQYSKNQREGGIGQYMIDGFCRKLKAKTEFEFNKNIQDLNKDEIKQYFSGYPERRFFTIEFSNE